jgi:uncharacterized membrane protein YsdA (DUF1294 family)
MARYWLYGLLILYAVIGVIALGFYAADKRYAIRHAWRVPEKVLLGLGFFGGAWGALLGMKLFRHKTKHWYFWAVNWIGLLWQAGLLVYIVLTCR